MKDKWITVRMSTRLFENLESKAKEIEASKTQIVRTALLEYLNKKAK